MEPEITNLKKIQPKRRVDEVIKLIARAINNDGNNKDIYFCTT
jgi:hypothetical protein